MASLTQVNSLPLLITYFSVATVRRINNRRSQINLTAINEYLATANNLVFGVVGGPRSSGPASCAPAERPSPDGRGKKVDNPSAKSASICLAVLGATLLTGRRRPLLLSSALIRRDVCQVLGFLATVKRYQILSISAPRDWETCVIPPLLRDALHDILTARCSSGRRVVGGAQEWGWAISKY